MAHSRGETTIGLVPTGRLPDFVVIGAMKAGTSSLHRMLGTHPDLFTSKRKEVEYFTLRYDTEPIEEYMAHFAEAGARKAGESSPNYSKRHMWPDTAERLAKHLPDVRIIYLVRNPIDRLISHYRHNMRRRSVLRDFEETMSENSNYVPTSMYAYQLDPYLEHFSKDQIHLVRSEDLREYPNVTVEKILQFLEVDESAPIELNRRDNTSNDQERDIEIDYEAVKGLRVRSENGRKTLDVTDEVRGRLAAQLEEDVSRLMEMFPDFEGWDLG